MELLFPWCPIDLALMIFDFVSLEDITRWEWDSDLEDRFLPESYLLKKLTIDFQEIIHDVKEIKHWRKTFEHLHELEHKKAKMVKMSQDDILRMDGPKNTQEWVQKYPALEYFTQGDIAISLDFFQRFVLEIQNSEYFYFVPHYKTTLRIIEDLPLKFFSTVCQTWEMSFSLRPEIVFLHTTVDRHGATWCLRIFVHRNVSYGIVSKENYHFFPSYICYPCEDVLCLLNFSPTVLSAHHLAFDRICVQQTDFAYLMQIANDNGL